MQGKYQLELDKVVAEIQKVSAKNVMIQVPDGMKPEATTIVKELEEKTGANVMIWFGACWGSCDLPPEIKDVDLLVQFGHSPWPFWKDHEHVKVVAAYTE